MRLKKVPTRPFLALLCVVPLIIVAQQSLQAPQVGLAYVASTHGRIVDRAWRVFLNDGKIELARRLNQRTRQRPNRTYLDGIIDGVIGADEIQSGRWWKHGHNPFTHRGWELECISGAFSSAADEAARHFSQAVKSWREGRDYAAMYQLGEALHHVQDPTVPHHAAATRESASSNPLIPAACAGNGSHDWYENWIKTNYNQPTFPHTSNDGIYSFTALSGHYDPQNPYGWADFAAHGGITRYEEVNNVSDLVASCDPLPDFDTSNNICYNVASHLVAFVERLTAGFISFFFDTVLGAPPPPPPPPPSAQIYVSDRGNHRIVQMNDMTGAGWMALGGGTCGNGVLQFCSQHRIFVDGSVRIYVADNGNYRVVRMNDITGTGWLSFGGQGSGVGQFNSVVGIFVDGTGRIYVTDPSNARLVRVNDMSGSGWTELGGFQSGLPTAVVVDTQGRIYLADAGRIVRVNDMTGAGRVTFGSVGSGVGQFGGNIDVALDGSGRIYIADENNHRIVRIDDMSGGGWVSFGSMGSGVGQFQFPQGLYVDDLGRIFVVDSGNARIVRINDMTGSGWVTFGVRGTGVGQFDSPYDGHVR